jgi:hypothetical protein
VTGGGDTTLLTWDLAPHPSSADASERRAHWWDELAADPPAANRAVAEMVAAPAAAVAELKARLRPVAAPDRGRVADLVRRLDGDRFADRERAAADLAGLGEPVAPLLRAARERATTEEARSRLDAVLKRLGNAGTADRLRERRAVEVLERVRTADARAVLDALAGGASGAGLTERARAAVRRLDRAP